MRLLQRDSLHLVTRATRHLIGALAIKAGRALEDNFHAIVSDAHFDDRSTAPTNGAASTTNAASRKNQLQNRNPRLVAAPCHSTLALEKGGGA
jgi:hypothetical protein